MGGVAPRWSALSLLAVIVAACAGPAARAPAGEGEQRLASPHQTKTLTIALTTPLDAIGPGGRLTPVGGWGLMDEIHSNGLVTSEVGSRKPIGRLAEQIPSLDDGTIALLPDGRMRVTYHLRSNVFWQDGAPFTADDLVFTQRIESDPIVPLWRLEAVKEMESTEAPDPQTFSVTFRQPYYRGASMGLFAFWPLPRHLLEPAYDRDLAGGPPEDILQLAFWSTGYVQLGPFRVVAFDPGESIRFEAHNEYFLGRPKLDVVVARIFGDQGTLLSSLFAGAVDLLPDLALTPERGAQLKERWDASGEGTVHIREGAPFVLTPQFRPAYQRQAAILAPVVRAALYSALDRDALSDALNGGQHQFAGSILGHSDELYEATADALRQYRYDPDRARTMLRTAGWNPGPDGVVRHEGDGQRFQTSITATPGRERDIAAFAASWRQIGIEVEEVPMAPTLVRDRELRAQFPGWEATGAASGHGILDVIRAPAALPANRWVGNRPGYEDPRADRLIETLRSSLTEREQLQAMRTIGEFVAAELPFLMLYHLADYLAIRQGVNALDDLAGGQGGNPVYGSYSRNAYLWDMP